jgi:hypothetical protein
VASSELYYVRLSELVEYCDVLRRYGRYGMSVYCPWSAIFGPEMSVYYILERNSVRQFTMLFWA